ncbi:unnamed protein product [Strongylus vulgaris]|uniref:Uncharacterized protein n=1 Tax=Strongylus vulgaris TaxID=40348 RepID=A0A3P7LCC4_STRVU|nr:unnamed protein product [Strongylus vulgaris]
MPRLDGPANPQLVTSNEFGPRERRRCSSIPYIVDDAHERQKLVETMLWPARRVEETN